MKVPRTRWRRFTWAAVGFALGYALVYCLFLADAMVIGEFEALYGMARPRSIRGWLDFQAGFHSLFLVTGVVGALLGVVASFARSRRRITEPAT